MQKKNAHVPSLNVSEHPRLLAEFGTCMGPVLSKREGCFYDAAGEIGSFNDCSSPQWSFRQSQNMEIAHLASQFAAISRTDKQAARLASEEA